MYRKHSPVRSKGIKIKNVLQVCLLVAVCFWLIFQIKRSHDKKKDFDKLTSRLPSGEEIVKFGRKDLAPELDETVKEVEKHEQEEEDEEEEEKIDEEKDDEIDQEKSDVEIDREEVDIIDEDKETEEIQSDKENEDKEEETQTDEEHTHELREEHYKADDASSAVTHDGPTLGTEHKIKNGTLDNSSDNVAQTLKNATFSNIQENDSEPRISSVNPASSIDFLENGPPSNTTVITSDTSQDQNVTATEEVSNSTYVSENSGSNETKVETDESDGENLETSNLIEGTEETLDPVEVQHLDEKV